jgi:hypothetical protein
MRGTCNTRGTGWGIHHFNQKTRDIGANGRMILQFMLGSKTLQGLN